MNSFEYEHAHSFSGISPFDTYEWTKIDVNIVLDKKTANECQNN